MNRIGYEKNADATSASLNSVTFYTCQVCGGCVVEHDDETINRERHNNWHDREVELP